MPSRALLRLTLPTQLVLKALLDHRSRETYGLEICRATGLASGTVHPIMARLEGLGWLESRWDDVDPAAVGRPRRRYYRLTPDGVELAITTLDSARTPVGLLGGGLAGRLQFGSPA